MLRVAVVGGGAGGMATASRVKRLMGSKAEVVVFEEIDGLVLRCADYHTISAV